MNEMTIKEIEKLSGMNRSNIRFYEKEGLIAPKRLDNGYRDYSEEDLQILLRIKLLRSLHISLDEINDLKNGSKNLTDMLSKQIIRLDQEKQEASYAQDVCRAMQVDSVTFAELDARKYLEEINRTIVETGSTYFSVKGDEFPQVFHPWRRYLARTFDILLYNVLWSSILALIFHINLIGRSNWSNILDSFIAIIIMMFLEPLLLHLFGTTLGKLIFGLRIENPDGSNLSYWEGLERTWGVISVGMGYNIPIYSLIRIWKSYELCIDKETQPWDESISYTIKDIKWYRSLFYITCNVAVFAVLMTIMSAQKLPPNRGDLTVKEFVENYNYYAKYFGLDFGNQYLDENGRRVENEFDGDVYIEFGKSDKPEYHFATDNGYVTGVSFEVEIKNNKGWVNSYNTEMILSSLAFASAQNEMKLFSKMQSRIAEQIENNTFKDFHFEEAGITFTSNIKYSGYQDTQIEILIPVENSSETYFNLSLSMNK